MAYYYLYDYVLKTDIAFDMLIQCPPSVIGTENLISLFVNSEFSDEPEFFIPFKEDIKYYLFPSKNIIHVHTENLAYLFSSFFNIPMSVFTLFKGKAIIHCNALNFNNSLLCFSGNKGIGKTTLSMHLKNHYELFSDDCISLNAKDAVVYGYRAAQTIKLCRNTYDMLINDENYANFHDELSNKAILPINDNSYKYMPLKKMFFMVRGLENTFTYERVDFDLTKKVLLIQSIAGKDYIPQNIKNIFSGTNLFKSIINYTPFYFLHLPPISEYDSQIKSFIQAIEEDEL